MTATELNLELRKLIDTRLDEIDRVLARAQMPWSERRSIVGEVETQIFELLTRRGETPTSEIVLEILGSLDPAESFLPEGIQAPLAATVSPTTWTRQTIRFATRFGAATINLFGLLIVNGVVLVLIALSNGVLPWIITLSCLGWINYAGIRRFRAWSATRRGNLVNELRDGLAAWIMTKNRAPAT